MNLQDLLEKNKSSIVKKWAGSLVESYPEDSRRFLKKEKNRFSNPVGQTIFQGIDDLFDEIVKGEEEEKISSSLEGIIKIRAVQELTPSQAVAFILQLKHIIREKLVEDITTNGLPDEFRAFEQKIDDLMLLAFDIYSTCRQKIYELRVNDVKRQVSRLLERANLVCEIPETNKELGDI